MGLGLGSGGGEGGLPEHHERGEEGLPEHHGRGEGGLPEHHGIKACLRSSDSTSCCRDPWSSCTARPTSCSLFCCWHTSRLTPGLGCLMSITMARCLEVEALHARPASRSFAAGSADLSPATALLLAPTHQLLPVSASGAASAAAGPAAGAAATAGAALRRWWRAACQNEHLTTPGPCHSTLLSSK